MPNTLTRVFKDNNDPGIYIGIVKDVSDAQKSGRLRVWIPEFNSDPEDPSGWRLVNYCSPFAGATNYENNTTKVKDYEGTQQSYGFWMVPPDVGVHVLVAFASNRSERGFWLGCLYSRFANHMVPGIAKGKNYKDPDKELPCAEYNKHEKVAPNPTREDRTNRPYHRDKTNGIASKGLINDNIRGLSTSSARRETPSEVFGINTPGPIEKDKKHRKGGHSFVMDDKDGNEHITFETRSGSKIKIDESNGLLYFINRKGTAWFQMDEDGNVDFFGAESISMRAQKDFNIRADGNVNIEAGQNVNIKAAKDTNENYAIVGEGSGQGGDIFMQANGNVQNTVEGDVFFTVTNGNLDINVANGNKKETVSGDVDESYGGNLKTTVGGDIEIEATNITSQASEDFAFTGTNSMLSSGANATLHVNGNVLGVKTGWFGTTLTGGLSLGVTPVPPVPPATGSSVVLPDAIPEASDLIVTGKLVVEDTVNFKSNLYVNSDVSVDGSVSAGVQVHAPSVTTTTAALESHIHATSTGPSSPPTPVPQVPPVFPPLEPLPPEKPGGPISPEKPDIIKESAETAETSEPKSTGGKTNILEDFESEKMYKRKTQSVQTTVERFITFEPCPEHKKKGD